MSMYDKNHYNICKVISLQLIKINGKNKIKSLMKKKNKGWYCKSYIHWKD